MKMVMAGDNKHGVLSEGMKVIAASLAELE
jgi:hypothetical protein